MPAAVCSWWNENFFKSLIYFGLVWGWDMNKYSW